MICPSTAGAGIAARSAPRISQDHLRYELSDVTVCVSGKTRAGSRLRRDGPTGIDSPHREAAQTIMDLRRSKPTAVIREPIREQVPW